MNKNNNNKKNKGVSVTKHFLNTLVSIADGLSATAIAAIVAHLYFGEVDIILDMVLYSSFAVLLLVSIWMRSISKE